MKTMGPNVEALLSRITINPKVMLGKPTIRGLRITVEQLLRSLSRGVSELELLEDYPELEKEDFQAVFVSFRMINFASEK